MKILVFGGSFDPPHRGHAALLLAAARKIRPDRIVLVPAFHAPLKGKPRARAEERLTLIRIGLVSRLTPRYRAICRVDSSELRVRRQVFTVETLRRLSRENPGAELHFVTGSDSAASFPRWRESGALRKLAAWWTGRRPGASAPPPFFRLLPGRFPAVSSTEARLALLRGESARAFLDPTVEACVRRRGLYDCLLVGRLKKLLKPPRFEHTLAVARLAGELAERWDVDAEKAVRAALLHDLGRSLSVAEMPAYARRRRLPVPALAQTAARNPLLLHAYVSADLARRAFGVADAEILSAVARHTLGGVGMSLFERLIYVADAASYDRAYAGAAKIRSQARGDLDEAFKTAVRMKIEHALSRGAWLHPATISLWNELAAS